MKAIETQYKGYRFRSRLEARWAKLFDALGVRWDYEKEGYDLGDGVYYLPDFWLPDHDLFVEVKGERDTFLLSEDYNKIYKLKEQSGKEVVVVFNIPNASDLPVNNQYVHWYGTRVPVSPSLSNAQMIAKAFGSTEQWWVEGGAMMACPMCGDQYVHMGQVNTKDTDDYDVWQGRGGATRIEMYCESGCAWTLRFGFHKGNTFVAIENPSETCYDFILYLAELNPERKRIAVEAARSARFEHGEPP